MLSKSLFNRKDVIGISLKYLLFISSLPLILHVIFVPLIAKSLHQNLLWSYNQHSDFNVAVSLTKKIEGDIENLHCSGKKLISDKSAQISRINIIGERHSGVHQVYDFLVHHVSNISVAKGLIRGPYWFQNGDYEQHNIDINNTLLIILTRDPYEWFQAMHKRPLHAPNHHNLDWTKFVKKQWVIKTSPQDKTISNAYQAKCQEGFNGGSVIPCRRNDAVVSTIMKNVPASLLYPAYETHMKDKHPYKNIIQLRRAKMLHYIGLSSVFPNVQILSADVLLNSDGQQKARLNDILQFIHSLYDIDVCLTRKIHDTKLFTQIPRRDYLNFNSLNLNSTRKYKKNVFHHLISEKILDKFDFLSWLTCNVHWNIEAKLNYKKLKNFNFDPYTGKKLKCSPSTISSFKKFSKPKLRSEW